MGSLQDPRTADAARWPVRHRECSGAGHTVRLIAPRGASEEAAATHEALNHSATRPTPHRAVTHASGPALKILIVDDHAGVRDMFREMLQERQELRVVGEAANGLEAIAKAHALRPDVILMDVVMPEMDGVEATRRIRAELPFIQILALTTLAHGDNVHAIERFGAAGFFTKGVDTQRLVDHLMMVHTATTLGSPQRTLTTDDRRLRMVKIPPHFRGIVEPFRWPQCGGWNRTVDREAPKIKATDQEIFLQ